MAEHKSFEEIVDLGSVPPPPGEVPDVHAARTAVAAVPDGFLDELRNGRLEEAARMLRDGELAPRAFPSEAPTRPRDLGTILEAVAPPPEVSPPPPRRRPTLPSVPITFEELPAEEITAIASWRRDAARRAAVLALAALSVVVLAIVLVTLHALATGP